MTEIKVPSVGESITEVVIGQWLVEEGATVDFEQPVALLETDKVNVELPAPAAGVMSKLHKPAGASAAVGEVIAELEPSGAQAGAAQPAKSDTKTTPPAAASGPARPAAAPQQGPPPAAPSAAVVMPAAQRLAAQAGIDAQQVTGTGRGGRILKEDVQVELASRQAGNAVKPPAPVSSPSPSPSSTPRPPTAGQRIVPMTPMRRRIAERLVNAQQTAAILTTFNEVDMTEVMALRRRLQDGFVKKHGTKLGFMSFFVKACIDALRAYPEVNAEVRGTDLIYNDFYDIGVAVGSSKGLVVPVLRGAEHLGFGAIEQQIVDFGSRAGSGKIKLEEMQGGTFTISNGGVYGSLMSTPILNPPQSGILGMHNIVERPIGVQGKIELRPMMYLALSYDHRIVDGRGAVSFVRRVKECIEDPSRMLLEA